MLRAITTMLVITGGLMSAVAAEVDRQAADEAAIRKAVESYVAAFNQADAKKLAGFCPPPCRCERRPRALQAPSRPA